DRMQFQLFQMQKFKMKAVLGWPEEDIVQLTTKEAREEYCRNRDSSIAIMMGMDGHNKEWDRRLHEYVEKGPDAKNDISKMVTGVGKMAIDAGRSFKANALSPAMWSSMARGLMTSPKWKAVPKFAG
ncbi:MAG: hypothetical protein M1823_002403, partial [Watsoniomyces obsoletus]